MTISNTVFTGNISDFTAQGGAMILNGTSGTVNIFDSQFTNNRAGDGGAIFTRNNRLIISNTLFEGNQSTAGTGVLFNGSGSASNVSITGSIIRNNLSIGGSALLTQSVNFNINTSCIIANDSEQVDFRTTTGSPIDATDNYWGSPDGPLFANDGVQPDRTSISGNINVVPFQTVDTVCN
ncbi:MAG: hypothetical protein AAFR67_01190 [Chloroflexota bacterium]